MSFTSFYQFFTGRTPGPSQWGWILKLGQALSGVRIGNLEISSRPLNPLGHSPQPTREAAKHFLHATLKVLNFAIFDHFRDILYPRKVSKPQIREMKYPQNRIPVQFEILFFLILIKVWCWYPYIAHLYK